MEQPIKDLDNPQPIPLVWRSTLEAIATAISEGDLLLSRSIRGCSELSSDTQKLIASNVEDYGADVVGLSDETWTHSQAMYQGNGRWDIIVDLATTDEPVSDLSIVATVCESPAGWKFEIDGVWVE